MPLDSELARLLEHPAIWRGRSAARTETLPTGFDALDECLPGRGWPRTGLTEILVPRPRHLVIAAQVLIALAVSLQREIPQHPYFCYAIAGTAVFLLFGGMFG